MLFPSSIYVLFHVWKSRLTDRTVVILHFCLFVACTLHYALEFNHFYTHLVSKTGSILSRVSLTLTSLFCRLPQA